jgi:hypothetical protein
VLFVTVPDDPALDVAFDVFFKMVAATPMTDLLVCAGLLLHWLTAGLSEA